MRSQRRGESKSLKVEGRRRICGSWTFDFQTFDLQTLFSSMFFISSPRIGNSLKTSPRYQALSIGGTALHVLSRS